MTTKEPTKRRMNARYSYTKKYSSLKEGIFEVFAILPELEKIIFTSPGSMSHFYDTLEDEQIAQQIFESVVENVKNDFPTIYDDIYPATLALSITGDRFYYRSKNRLSLIWEYDRSFKETGEIHVSITVQFKEPTNKLRSQLFTNYINKLKEAGYEYNPSLDEYNNRRRNNDTEDSETQQP